MEVPAGSNMTAATLGAMKIPRGVHRLLFRTDNTAHGLMRQLAFDSSYAAFTLGGVYDLQFAMGIYCCRNFLVWMQASGFTMRLIASLA